MRNRLIALAALVAISAPQLGGQSPRRVNFVSCPIVQDTATVPCWLSEYEGEQYYLGIQTDISAEFDPPYLGHQALVEGIVAGGYPSARMIGHVEAGRAAVVVKP